MARISISGKRLSVQLPLSPQARSNTRLALVAGTVLATVGVLILVTLQVRAAERALDDSAAHTLSDYTGYAGRMLGAEVLRRFAEQRAMVLAPVTGNSRGAGAGPALEEVVERGDRVLHSDSAGLNSPVGYFRVDLRTGAMEQQGAFAPSLAAHVRDTLRFVAHAAQPQREAGILAMDHDGVPYSVAHAWLRDDAGHARAVYGFTYVRTRGIAAMADRVFRETPLLPISYAGSRWNYDAVHGRSGEVVNDALLAMRITDRSGRELWSSPSHDSAASSPYHERVLLSTITGGIVVESALRASSATSLVPGVVRRAQRWSLTALLGLTALLAVVSLLALRGERLGARERRAEAMQQLALGLRHELNNALASVMLNAELMREEKSLDEAMHERLEAIVEQADRMRSVLRRLEKTDRLDVVVPYLNEGYMVDLSPTLERDARLMFDPDDGAA
jgi:hypothetical protein